MGIYSEWSEKYFKHGLNTIPVNGKVPLVKDWQNYCRQELPHEIMSQWSLTLGMSNIGLTLGPLSNLLGFDLDYLHDKEWDEKSKLSREEFYRIKAIVTAEEGEIKKAIKAMLPHSPCVKIGKPDKLCFLYRPKGPFQSISVDRYGIRLFDILWDGRQTVMPPSIHPETNLPYRWMNGDLIKHLDDIPELEWDLVLKIKEKFELSLEKLGVKGDAQFSGRNDLLKKAVFGMFKRGLKPEACVDHLMSIDREKNAPPLFTDKSEFKVAPEKAALKFAQSNYRSFKSNVQADRLNPEIKLPPEQVGFYFRYYVPRDDGGVKVVDVPQYKLMADYCFEKKNMCFDDATSLKFDGKKWSWFTKTELTSFIIEQNNECIKPAHLDGFSKMIRGRCFEAALGIKNPEGLINVNNGVVNVKTGGLERHSYKHMFKYCAGVDFIEGAQCPKWENFLFEVFEKNLELIDLAQRLFGYIIIGGRPFLHRAFVLFGEGRNGKSTFLDILRAVVGSDSYSVVSMAKLDKEFSIVNIDGKLANIVEETPTDQINAEIFKNLVGGGLVQAAHKGFDEYTFRCNARFVFACNEMPIFKDKSVGLEDRLVIIPFTRYFKEDERDTEITEKLLEELPGILNWAVEGAKMIIKDRKLPQYEITKEAKEMYRHETNPFYAWFCDEIIIDPLAPQISVRQVYERYKKDCEENGNRAYSKDRFAKQFRQLLRSRCAELKIPFNADLRSPSGDSRVFEVVRLKSHLPALTPQNHVVSDKKDYDN